MVITVITCCYQMDLHSKLTACSHRTVSTPKLFCQMQPNSFLLQENISSELRRNVQRVCR